MKYFYKIKYSSIIPAQLFHLLGNNLGPRFSHPGALRHKSFWTYHIKLSKHIIIQGPIFLTQKVKFYLKWQIGGKSFLSFFDQFSIK